MILLDVRGLRKKFFGVEALRGIDLQVHSQEIVGLIGPNGSGKTTLFNCITGQYRADSGRVFYRGREVTGQKPFRIALAGLTRSFQMVRIYSGLTVLENLLVAIQEHQERNVLARILRFRAVKHAETTARQRAEMILREFELSRLGPAPAGTLSYGQRKLLQFAAVIMPDPDLVMLDEPAAAINPTMINNMKAHIRRLHSAGKAFLIIEHNMSVVLDICQRIVVLDHGEKIAEGIPSDIRQNPSVLEVYFGH